MKNKNYGILNLSFIDSIIEDKRLEMFNIIKDKINNNPIESFLDIGTTEEKKLKSSNFFVKKFDHIQIKKSQAKIITVTHGKILDIAVDLRKNSKTFGKYVSIEMSHKDDFSFYIPKGFAHGFLCLSKECTVNYKCSEYRDPKYEKTLNWKDKAVNIKWPTKNVTLSNKDMYLGLNLKEFLNY
jgi:dTDP-4-dehydrorhamnose 3,5-epimerase